MSVPPATEGPIDVHLSDGGHVIVTFGSADARTAATGDGMLAVLLDVDGSEDELERAILDEAEACGLRASTSGSRHPTTVVIETEVVTTR
jgi:hypothetical protein